MTPSPNRRYSGHHKATEEEGNQGILTENRSGERNMDSRIQVQLEEDGGGSTRQSWMETSGLWIVLHVAVPLQPTVTRSLHSLPAESGAEPCPLKQVNFCLIEVISNDISFVSK